MQALIYILMLLICILMYISINVYTLYIIHTYIGVYVCWCKDRYKKEMRKNLTVFPQYIQQARTTETESPQTISIASSGPPFPFSMQTCKLGTPKGKTKKKNHIMRPFDSLISVTSLRRNHKGSRKETRKASRYD